MGFWDSIRKDIEKGVKEVRTGWKEGLNVVKAKALDLTREARRMASSGTAAVTAETGRMARLGKIRYERLRLSQAAQTKFTDLGGRMYDLIQKKRQALTLDAQTGRMVEEIRRLEQQIKALEAEARQLSKQVRRAPSAKGRRKTGARVSSRRRTKTAKRAKGS